MLLGEFKAAFTHGLLVIAAPESVDAHEEWDPARSLVHAREDSIYCGVADAATGLVHVTCVEEATIETDLSLMFSGRLTLPSARLEFYDPNETIRLVVPVTWEQVAVTIYADDDEEPTEVLVRLDTLA
jgi:hypothetical protein